MSRGGAARSPSGAKFALSSCLIEYISGFCLWRFGGDLDLIELGCNFLERWKEENGER